MAVTWKKLALDEEVVRKDLFDANTILKADTDDTPSALTVDASRIIGRKSTGGIAALTAAEVLTIINVESGADVTDATNVDAAGAVMETDYNAYTILAADTDNTPAALTVAASTFVGRKDTGGIVAMTKTEALAVLNVEDGADVTDSTNVDAAGAVMATDYDAYTVLAADSNDTPFALTVNASTFIGRKASGGISAMTATEARTVLNVEDGADVTDSTNVDAAGAVMETDFNAYTVLYADTDNTPAALTVGSSTFVGRKGTGGISAMTATEARTVLNVEDGADVTDATNVDAAGAVMETDYNAYTILAADTDNTPAALSVAASRFVGRKSTGGITAMTPVEVLAELTGQATSSFGFNNQRITDVADPVSAQDVATKAFVESVAAGLDPKTSCRVATTAELNATFVHNGSGNNGVGDTLTNAGAQAAIALDGVSLSVDDRVLVKNQTTTVAEVSSVDTVDDVSGSLGGKYFLISAYANSSALLPTDYYVWYDVDNGSSDPNVAGRTGIEVDISADDEDDTIATATETVLEALNSGETFDVSIGGAGSNEMTITNLVGGAVANAGAGDSGFTVGTDTPGTSNKKCNGIFTVTTVGSGSTNWVLTRAVDCNNSPDGEVSAGNFTFIEEGTVNANAGFVMTTKGTINMGDVGDDTASDVVYVQFSGAGSIEAGSGLQKSGNTISIKHDGGTLVSSANGLKLASDQVMNSTNIDSNGAVMETDFNAYTILAADTDDTPTALTVGASTFVGRKASGGIVAMTKTEALAVLNVEDGADVTDATNVAAAGAVMDTDFNAKGDILSATADDTPAVLTVGSNGLALVADSSEATGLKWAAPTPAAHATSHKNGGTDEILLHELGEPTAAVAFDGQQATNLVVHNVANQTALDALTGVIGKIAFKVDTTDLWLCTAVS